MDLLNDLSVKNKKNPEWKRKVKDKFSSYQLGDIDDVDDPDACCFQCGKAGYMGTNIGHYSVSERICTCYKIG